MKYIKKEQIAEIARRYLVGELTTQKPEIARYIGENIEDIVLDNFPLRGKKLTNDDYYKLSDLIEAEVMKLYDEMIDHHCLTKKYKIEVTETLQKVIEIDAKDEKEALSLVRQQYKDGRIALDSRHYIDVEFNLFQDSKN
jgi:hypothetical protein